ncbi:hypothetical protein [Deinococcus gobiensis]|uniref:Lipoprotein n=1 Tax=Deinococcus gobiensis (strain DSM 21396 / JCM 16679 / CGMCC 1.7299 / I-0) TaxID=745776 RepID=H8GTI9_DEIGI|nr:hypothetical protein [Deinococcus gobiensis]AFD25317.1 hypothetical protein DGo_CA1390 [Deinococcus gobiensis I-0]
MKKRVPLLLSAAAACLLASCAPTLTGPVTGRIVNGQTGEEGTVSFTRGTLRPGYVNGSAGDNVVVRIGSLAYTGRTTIVNGGVVGPLPAGWGLSLGFGGGSRLGDEGALGWGTRLDTPAPGAAAVTSRTGNLIARTLGASPRTLTCTLTVDTAEHGIGDCTGSDGAKYALQF